MSNAFARSKNTVIFFKICLLLWLSVSESPKLVFHYYNSAKSQIVADLLHYDMKRNPLVLLLTILQKILHNYLLPIMGYWKVYFFHHLFVYWGNTRLLQLLRNITIQERKIYDMFQW